jgi:hypothetical protein
MASLFRASIDLTNLTAQNITPGIGGFLAGQLTIPRIQMLDFTLTYDGIVPSGGKGSHVPEKQAMRRAFHPQLRAWLTTGPLAATFKSLDQSTWQQFVLKPLSPFTGFKFVPVVAKSLNVICELDILMLKPEEPGRFVKNDGDLDNKLKILFDALRMPLDKGEVPPSDKPRPDEQPHFYCLLEDDALITKVTLRAERLLVLNPDPNSVRLIINVALRGTHLTNGNFPIGT